MIKKALLPALALVAASVAVPAAAQSFSVSIGATPASYVNYDRDYGWRSINQRQAQLDRRIDMGVRNGALSRREAASLRAEFQGIARLENQYRRGGLTRWERSDLDRRFDRLEQRIRVERRDRNDHRGRGGHGGRGW